MSAAVSKMSDHEGEDQAATTAEEMAALRQQLQAVRDAEEARKVEVAELKASLARQSETFEAELARMREAMKDGQSAATAGGESASASTTPISVTVKPQTPPPRLGVFTGLKPSGGMEVSFKDWIQRAEAYLAETPEPEESLRRIRGGLKGLTRAQTDGCKSAEEVLERLKAMYDTVKCTDDLLFEFSQARQNRGETVSDFFGRLWGLFIKLNEQKTFNEKDVQRKVYHAFVTQITATNPLLAMELRGAFGVPGKSTPKLEEVLRRVREVGEGPAQSSARAAGVAATKDGIAALDMDKLADLVAKKIQATSLNSSSTNPQPRVGDRVFRGSCFRCKETGHMARNCTKNLNANRSGMGGNL